MVRFADEVYLIKKRSENLSDFITAISCEELYNKGIEEVKYEDEFTANRI